MDYKKLADISEKMVFGSEEANELNSENLDQKITKAIEKLHKISSRDVNGNMQVMLDIDYAEQVLKEVLLSLPNS